LDDGYSKKRRRDNLAIAGVRNNEDRDAKNERSEIEELI
jgi:hypothetical protein